MAGPSGTASITRTPTSPLPVVLVLQLAVIKLRATTASAKSGAFHKPDIFILEKFSTGSLVGSGKICQPPVRLTFSKEPGLVWGPALFSIQSDDCLAEPSLIQVGQFDGKLAHLIAIIHD